MDFSYLMAQASRESSFDPTAKASTSSASGLYQFVEQTWLGEFQQHGGDYGYGRLYRSRGLAGTPTAPRPAQAGKRRLAATVAR